MEEDRLVGEFQSLFASSPDRLWRSPGRVTIIGDHTDYEGGQSLATAVSEGVLVGVRDRSDGRVRAESLITGEVLDVDLSDLVARMEKASSSGAPASGLTGFVGGVLCLCDRRTGADILVGGTLPPGAGLSSSAALSLALIGALSGADGPDPSWPAMAQTVENRYLGVPSGLLDELAILYARDGCAVLIDAGRKTAVAVPFDWEQAGRVLLIVDTGVSRRLSDTPYGERVQEARQAALRLRVPNLASVGPEDVERLSDTPLWRRRARHVTNENRRVEETVAAAARGDWGAVAALMRASHASLRDDYEVSLTVLDTTCALLDSLDPQGGARLTGAGFGGSAIALLPAEVEARARLNLFQMYDEHGFGTPRLLSLRRPARGLERIT